MGEKPRRLQEYSGDKMVPFKINAVEQTQGTLNTSVKLSGVNHGILKWFYHTYSR